MKCAVINHIRQQNLNELDINSPSLGMSSSECLFFCLRFNVFSLTFLMMAFGNLSSDNDLIVKK